MQHQFKKLLLGVTQKASTRIKMNLSTTKKEKYV